MQRNTPTVFSLVAIVLATAAVACTTTPREAEPLRIEKVHKVAPLEPPSIRRIDLDAVVEAGAGQFFARMPVEPHRVAGRFVGYRLRALYANVPPHPDGVHIGDVVTAVNEQPIARPEQFMKIWSGLGAARSIEIDVLRADRPLRVVYRIVEK